jgi:hypothetical protein
VSLDSAESAARFCIAKETRRTVGDCADKADRSQQYKTPQPDSAVIDRRAAEGRAHNRGYFQHTCNTAAGLYLLLNFTGFHNVPLDIKVFFEIQLKDIMLGKERQWGFWIFCSARMILR